MWMSQVWSASSSEPRRWLVGLKCVGWERWRRSVEGAQAGEGQPGFRGMAEVSVHQAKGKGCAEARARREVGAGDRLDAEAEDGQVAVEQADRRGLHAVDVDGDCALPPAARSRPERVGGVRASGQRCGARSGRRRRSR